MASSAADVIFAPATGAGKAALQVVRLSGPSTGLVLQRLVGDLPPARRATLRQVRGADGDVLDRGLVLWLPGPASYTGEDSAELHLHGGVAVRQAVIAALVAGGARLAEAGEFTRRAFAHGRMDLTEAEAVGDLIDAETEAQRRQAMRQLDGALRTRLAGLADGLRRALALAEALVDFPEETGAAVLPDHVIGELRDMAHAMEAEARSRAAERLRNGIEIVVVGAPNAGKSSLTNWLAGRDAAIVSAQPGTTRDVVETRVIMAGLPVTLVDTAGLRESDDPVEAEGVRRARARAQQADIVLHVLAADDRGANGADADFTAGDAPLLRVTSKRDLGPEWPDTPGCSLVSGAGLAPLRARLEAEVRRLTDSKAPAPLTRERHRTALAEAAAEIEAALTMSWPELAAEHLRLAMRALGRITGSVDVERVLGEIFTSFCIGK